MTGKKGWLCILAVLYQASFSVNGEGEEGEVGQGKLKKAGLDRGFTLWRQYCTVLIEIVMPANKATIEFKVNIVVEPDESGFHAYCPALKGLHVGGDTKEEALQNARDAAIAYLESLIKHGDPIPVGVSRRSSRTTASKTSLYTEDLKVACAI